MYSYTGDIIALYEAHLVPCLTIHQIKIKSKHARKPNFLQQKCKVPFYDMGTRSIPEPLAQLS